MRAVADRTADGEERLSAAAAAAAYLSFAREHAALYHAMFVLPTSLRFARIDTAPELKNAFAALRSAIPAAFEDGELATEAFWASLHGLAELERTGRIRPGFRNERIALVVAGLCRP